ncbi:MAG: outer membrane lipid asymmetry maintenance protein MlaD [Gammaproteobacteria bacterium RIFCSPHIGHO2_12_FULL_41_20]|nr:MAG: outer membrane lipid asymmetry maintenance protein MlaD [Gammaproteobacteria bacterium RIFCSPHIGHO2_12_FULL_41_20]
MISQRFIESIVGLFVLIAMLALLVLAFKVSGLTSFFPGKGFTVTAYFDDAGQLKIRAPVKIAGVQIGEVKRIELDPVTFKAIVTMRIYKKYNDIPDDSSASIMTAGLLGDNYITITPMYSQAFLAQGSQIQYTQPAIILEKLIGQFIYKLGNTDKEEQHEKP